MYYLNELDMTAPWWRMDLLEYELDRSGCNIWTLGE